MPKARAVPYPLEFRQKVVDLVRAGRSVKELAAEFEPSEQTIRNWLAQADADGAKRKDLLTSAEREILAKATAWLYETQEVFGFVAARPGHVSG
jgi:transposase